MKNLSLQSSFIHRVGWKKKWYSALTSDECPNPVLLGPALTVVVCCIHTSRSQGNLLRGFVNWSGHFVLKWGFTRTFPGNQDTTLK